MDFGENQKLIFNIISEKQPISESDIKDALPDEKKSISVSTVLKSLKNNKHAIKIKDGLYVVNPDFNVSVQEEATSSSAHEAIVYWPAPNNITTGPYDYKEMILGEKKKGEQLFRVNKRFLSLKNQWECAEENGTDLNCNYVVLINKKNSKKVEKAIQEDQGYIQFSKKVFEYEKIIHGNAFPRNNKDSVTAVVRMIDIENSTQVWRYDRNALIRMVDFILKDDNKFWKRLENGDIKLVDELALASKRQRDNEKSTNGKKSLASKYVNI